MTSLLARIKNKMSMKNDGKSAAAQTLLPVEQETVDRRTLHVLDPAANAAFHFCGNDVSTSRYSFIPLSTDFIIWRNLWEQFHKAANIYFLVISTIQIIPGISPTGRFTTLVPLVIVLFLTLCKDGWEDWKRRVTDRAVNQRKARVFRKGQWTVIEWQNVEVGDIVCVAKDEFFPADLACLYTSEGTATSGGICYIETASLDGETNLKLRRACGQAHSWLCHRIKITADTITEVPDVTAFRGTIACELPNAQLYHFEAYLQMNVPDDGKTQLLTRVPLNNDNCLLRGARLSNTRCVIGAVVYTGTDSKLMKNSVNKTSKSSTLEMSTNKQIFYVFCFEMLLCIICTVMFRIRLGEYEKNWYLGWDPRVEGYDEHAAISFLTFVILLNALIPISLYVMLEAVKLIQAALINNDVYMYYEERDVPAVARSSKLNEDLGQVQYIFSDKTGTLTCNKMEFSRFTCSTGVQPGSAGNPRMVEAYGGETAPSPVIASPPGSPRSRPANWSLGTRKFYDPRINNQQWIYQSNAAEVRSLLVTMAVCNTVLPERNPDTGEVTYQASSPDEQCLAKDDMELLTDTGFVDYAEARRRWDAGTLRVAGYDQNTRCLVYEKPTNFIDKEGAPADGMYEIKDRVDSGGVSFGYSIKITGDHQLLMECNAAELPWGDASHRCSFDGLGPVKPTVRQVLGVTLQPDGKAWPSGMKTAAKGANQRVALDDNDGILYHTPAAVNGLQDCAKLADLIPVADLAPAWRDAPEEALKLAGQRHHCDEPDKARIERALLELLGFWLGDGSFDAQSPNACYVLFAQVQQSDVVFLSQRFDIIGLQLNKDYTKNIVDRGDGIRVTWFRIHRQAWRVFIAGEFGCKYVNGRAVAAGLGVKEQAEDAWRREFGCEPPADDPIRARIMIENDDESSESEVESIDDESNNSNNNTPPLGTPSMGLKMGVAVSNANKNTGIWMKKARILESGKWFWGWVWFLGRAHCLALLAGLSEADGNSGVDNDKNSNCVFTSSAAFRDQVVRLAVHAGRSSQFLLKYAKGTVCGTKPDGSQIVARHDHWMVAISVPVSKATPVFSRKDIHKIEGYNQGVWCVRMSRTGNIVVRRRRSDSSRSFRPVIIGNCLVLAAQTMGVELIERTDRMSRVQIAGDPHPIEYETLAVVEFSSNRKRMSVVIRDQNQRIVLLSKGADTVILTRLRRDAITATDQTKKLLADFASEGLRTLVFARTELNKDSFVNWKRKYDVVSAALQERTEKMESVAETLERELELIGTTAIEDRLQDNVPHTIELLSKAGIKLWVVTGDKQETAINIGHSCSLIHHNMGMFRFDDCNETTVRGVMEKYLKEVESAALESGQDIALVIEGNVLQYVLPDPAIVEEPGRGGINSEYNTDLFVSLADKCKAVICCRASPIQKAQIVQAVRSRVDGVTLAIGDGANDVSMIQTAHVGVGVSGMEGLQAARAADYSIGQFEYLERLLLVHGRWNYRRVSTLIIFTFYKNMALFMTQFWFCIHNFWTGQSFYDQWSLAGYNLAFTAAPIMALAMFDRDVEPRRVLSTRQFPELYLDGLKGLYFNTAEFWLSTLGAIIHSVMCFYLPLRGGLYMYEPETGRMFGLVGDGIVAYTCILSVVTLKSGLLTYTWTTINLLFTVVSIYVWYLFLIVYCKLFYWTGLDDAAFYAGADVRMMSSIGAWLQIVLVISLALLRDFAVTAYKRTYNPSLVHSVQTFEAWGCGFDREDVKLEVPWQFPRHEVKHFKPSLSRLALDAGPASEASMLSTMHIFTPMTTTELSPGRRKAKITSILEDL